MVPVPFDPDAIWGPKPQHHVTGTVNGRGVRAVIEPLGDDPFEALPLIDYAGSSDASPYGINVVKNYTHAYTTFTVRSVLNPEIPNNHGSLEPIKMIAPGTHAGGKAPDWAAIIVKRISGCTVQCPLSVAALSIFLKT